MRAAVAAALVLSACSSDRPTVASCKDPLGGVWRGEGGKDYHALDHGRRVDFHPMFDSATPGSGRSAWLVSFDRATMRGTVSFWLTRDEETCRVTWPAELRSCADAGLVWAYQSGPIACGAAPREGWIEVKLRR